MSTSPTPQPDTVTHVSSIKLAVWALKQPDERLVDFYNHEDRSRCGCLMMQYFAEVLEPDQSGHSNQADHLSDYPSDYAVSCGNRSIGVYGNTTLLACYNISHPLQSLLLDESNNPSSMTTILTLRTFGEVKPYLQRFLAKMSS